MQHQGDGSAGIFVIVDADRSTDLFCGVLHLPETIRAAAVKIDTGVPHPDDSLVVNLHRLYMDTLILGAVHGPVQQVPKDKSEQILIGTHFYVSIYLVDDYCFATYGARKKTRHQFVYKTM